VAVISHRENASVKVQKRRRHKAGEIAVREEESEEHRSEGLSLASSPGI